MALILFFNRNEITHEISFFWLPVAQNTCTAQVVSSRLTFYFTKKKMKWKTLFHHLYQKQKFSLLFSID